MSTSREITMPVAADQTVPAVDGASVGRSTGRSAGYFTAVAALLSMVGVGCSGGADTSKPTGTGSSVDSGSSTTIDDLADPTTTVIVTTVPESTVASTDAPTTTIVESPIAEYQEVATFEIKTLEDRVKAFQYLTAGATTSAGQDGGFTFDLTKRAYVNPDALSQGLVDAIASSGQAREILLAYLNALPDSTQPYDLVLIDQATKLKTAAGTADEMMAVSAAATDGSGSVFADFASFKYSETGDVGSARYACATRFSFSNEGVPTLTRGVLFAQVFSADATEQLGWTAFVPFKDGVPEVASDLGVEC